MKSTRILLFVLFIFSLLPIVDIFSHKGIFFAHDIEQNIARFGAFYRTLSEGNIPPQWADGIANGYGGPVLIFSYSAPYYIASIFRFFGASLIDSIKLLMAVLFSGSGLLMFYWLKKHVSNLSAFGGALLYMYAPYRITDIYARGSISEQTGFFFVPLTLLALFTLFKNPNRRTIAFLSVSLSLLFLSHPFFVVIFSPLLILYTLLLFFHSEKNIKAIKYALVSLFPFLGIVAFFLIPLELEIKYTHYDISPFNGLSFYTQYNTISQLILPVWTFLGKYGTREYITYQVGLVHWATILLALPFLLVLKKKKKSLFSFAVFGFVGFLLSLFFMLPPSLGVYNLIRPLQQIQFPWRFLALSVASNAIVFAAILDASKKYKLVVLIIASVSIFSLYLPHANGHSYTEKSDRYYLEEFETNTEGPGTQPRWAASPENYSRPKSSLEIINGEGKVKLMERKTTIRRYKIDANSPMRFVENTFYFPGWSVEIDSVKTEIQYQDPDYRGLITFDAPAGHHTVNIVFLPTKVRRMAQLTSLVTILFTLGLLIIPSRKHRA